MSATKEKLIQLCDELFEKKLIGNGMIRSNKYDVCNGFIEFGLKPKNPKTRKAVLDGFRNLGYDVKNHCYDYWRVSWEDKEEIEYINNIFSKYENKETLDIW